MVQILATDNMVKIKQLGRLVRNYDENIWNGIRQIVVYQGLLEKFRQNEELKQQLLSTRDAILAESVLKDAIWGIGISMHNPERLDMDKW